MYTVAMDDKRKLIKAKYAEKGNNFYCPICKSLLILRKSGKKLKGSKRPHFAHHNLTTNCTSETALHFSFKMLLAEMLTKKIKEETKLNFSWNCQYCDSIHKGNLLKKIKSVKVEYNLKICQPDIALLDENEKIFAFIEIVVTHKPEEKVLKYYDDNNIILIQIELSSNEDIEKIDKKISKPNRVNFCFNGKCKKCNSFKGKKTMAIIEGNCWKCSQSMKVAVIYIIDSEFIGAYIYPSNFNQEEIKLAESKGVLLKMQYSYTAREKYIANTCSNCGSFAGDFYLFVDYISLAGIGYERFDMTYYCKYCDKNIYYDLLRRSDNTPDDDEGFDDFIKSIEDKKIDGYFVKFNTLIAIP